MVASRRNTAVSDQESPGPSVEAPERRLSVQSVETVAARVQHLSLTLGRRANIRLAWCIEAAYLGDLTAIAALATVAGRWPRRPKHSAPIWKLQPLLATRSSTVDVRCGIV